MFCGHNIWTEGGFVTQLSSDAGISGRRTVWVTANRRCMNVIIITFSLCIPCTFNSLDISMPSNERLSL